MQRIIEMIVYQIERDTQGADEGKLTQKEVIEWLRQHKLHV